MYGVSDPSCTGYFASLTDAVPSWATVTRGAGSWSRQTAPAVNGTTFLELGTAQNTGRFDYADSVGRSMLLIEPTRTNIQTDSNFVDANANNVPDGTWGVGVGTPGVDFTIPPGGVAPHGGLYLRCLDTAGRGCATVTATGAATGYGVSIWVRRVTANGAKNLNGCFPDMTIPLGSATHDWQRKIVIGTTGGVNALYMLDPNDAALRGEAWLALPDVEAGDCVTSYTSGTRAAELCTVDPSVVGRTSGSVSFLWRPDFASTTALTVSPCMWAWAAGYEIIYDPADDKIKVVVGGVNRASSAALTFARQGTVKITVRYGAAGTQLTTHVGAGAAATVADTNAWGDPGVLAPYLGSRAASVNCRPAAYADLLLAA